jgi:adenylate kinase
MAPDRNDDGGVGDIVFMGPPGVGKGTQSKALGNEKGWVHLSTGDLFRENIRRQTDLGKRVKAYLDGGIYVPDDVTVGMVRERLREIPPTTRIVFDGFPRTVAQAEALDQILAELGRRVAAVLLLEAPREELVARLGRRAKAEGRTDDTPEVIANRLDVYEKKTRPVIEHYDRRGMVRRVNAIGTIPEVTARLRQAADAAPADVDA